MPSVRQQQRSEQLGAALIEMALVLPLFSMLVVGMMEFGVMFLKDHGMATACREAARRLVVTPDSPTRSQEIQQVVCENLQPAMITCPGSVTITSTPATKRGDASKVMLESEQPFLTGAVMGLLGMPSTIKLTKICVMRDEVAPR